MIAQRVLRAWRSATQDNCNLKGLALLFKFLVWVLTLGTTFRKGEPYTVKPSQCPHVRLPSTVSQFRCPGNGEYGGYRGYTGFRVRVKIGIIEKKMETTILYDVGLGLRMPRNECMLPLLKV